MAPRLPGLMKGQVAAARLGLGLLGCGSACSMHWAAPWNQPGAPHQGDPPAAMAAFVRALPILQPLFALAGPGSTK